MEEEPHRSGFWLADSRYFHRVLAPPEDEQAASVECGDMARYSADVDAFRAVGDAWAMASCFDGGMWFQMGGQWPVPGFFKKLAAGARALWACGCGRPAQLPFGLGLPSALLFVSYTSQPHASLLLCTQVRKAVATSAL